MYNLCILLIHWKYTIRNLILLQGHRFRCLKKVSTWAVRLFMGRSGSLTSGSFSDRSSSKCKWNILAFINLSSFAYFIISFKVSPALDFVTRKVNTNYCENLLFCNTAVFVFGESMRYQIRIMFIHEPESEIVTYRYFYFAEGKLLTHRRWMLQYFFL